MNEVKANNYRILYQSLYEQRCVAIRRLRLCIGQASQLQQKSIFTAKRLTIKDKQNIYCNLSINNTINIQIDLVYL